MDIDYDIQIASLAYCSGILWHNRDTIIEEVSVMIGNLRRLCSDMAHCDIALQLQFLTMAKLCEYDS